MNKNSRAQRNLWKDEALKAIAQATTEEEERSQDERAKIGRRDFRLARTRELVNISSCTGDERATKELWISKKILGKTPAQNPDAPRIAPRYEAWPVEGETPEWLRKCFADEHWLWNALALPIQHTISRIQAQQREVVAAIYKEAEASGLDTQDDHIRKKLSPKIRAALKGVNFSALAKILKERDVVLEEGHRIRGSEVTDPEAEMQRLGWSKANWNFAVAVSNLPAWLQRIVEKRLHAASKARRTRRNATTSEKWSHGYPKPDPEDRTNEGRLDVYFNGDNVEWSSGSVQNGYLDISSRWNPPDHRGPRTGKYRSLREMRKITIYEPGVSARKRTKKENKNRFTLNVLFHAVPAGALMKEYKLRAQKDANGKLRWFFIPTFELGCIKGPEQRRFAGVDVGWRKSGDMDFKHVHCWSEGGGYKPHELTIRANRWSRRYNNRQAKVSAENQFPVEMTPAGLRDFASRRATLLRDFKVKMGEFLKSEGRLTASWDRIGRRGIARMITNNKSPEFATLQCLRAAYDAWAERDVELARIYRTAWAMVSENLDKQRREIARKVLLDVTDVGVEALDVKQMAQAENEGTTNWERHIENIQDRSRQLTGPAKFLSTLVNTARKMGKRVHQIDPYRTSKTCSDCGHANEIGVEEHFTCTVCGRAWNRDENAARNLARLARECAADDTHPLRCSRDGKSTPFHGFRTSVGGNGIA